MGAWIETSSLPNAVLQDQQSHPTWVRGLKHDVLSTTLRHHTVAPYMGAWIETAFTKLRHHFDKSHPTWVRGLKHDL